MQATQFLETRLKKSVQSKSGLLCADLTAITRAARQALASFRRYLRIAVLLELRGLYEFTER